MANQRKQGLKMVGAFVDKDIDEALTIKANELGYKSKADYLRDIFQSALLKEKEELTKIFCGRYGYIAAGVGYQNPETATYEEEVELPPNLHKYKEKGIYAVRVVGDSMLPKYEDGQDVFILPQDTAENGQTVAVLLPDGSNVLKVYRRDEQSSWLESRNKDKYPEKIEKFQLRGVVVHP